jgi:hypothetical protein
MVSLLVPWVFSQYKPIYHVGRYEIISLPPLAIFLAMVFEEIFSPKRALKMLVVIAITGYLWEYFYSIYGDQVNNRWAVKEFLHMANAGDVVVFAGLSRPALTYYLRRDGRYYDYVLLSYPMELEQHPAWGSRGWFLRDTLQLLEDARNIKEKLDNLKDASLWVFWDDPVITGYLFRELKEDYRQVRIVDLGRKTFFRFLSQFKKKNKSWWY